MDYTEGHRDPLDEQKAHRLQMPGGGGALEYLGVLGAWRSQWLSGIRGSLGGVGDFYGTLTAHKEYKASETADGLGWHLTLWGHTWGS